MDTLTWNPVTMQVSHNECRPTEAVGIWWVNPSKSSIDSVGLLVVACNAKQQDLLHGVVVMNIMYTISVDSILPLFLKTKIWGHSCIPHFSIIC